MLPDANAAVDSVYRSNWRRIVATLIRLVGDFDVAEEAAQEAFAAATWIGLGVLPSTITTRLAVEAGRSLGWERWVGARGAIIAVDRFGASAPGEVIMKELGFTTERVVQAAEILLGRRAT